MQKTGVIRARMEPTLKVEVEKILAQLGLTISETIHLLYCQIKLRKGLPFDVCLPNRLTAKTLSKGRIGRDVKHFAKKEDLYKDLGL